MSAPDRVTREREALRTALEVLVRCIEAGTLVLPGSAYHDMARAALSTQEEAGADDWERQAEREKEALEVALTLVKDAGFEPVNAGWLAEMRERLAPQVAGPEDLGPFALGAVEDIGVEIESGMACVWANAELLAVFYAAEDEDTDERRFAAAYAYVEQVRRATPSVAGSRETEETESVDLAADRIIGALETATRDARTLVARLRAPAPGTGEDRVAQAERLLNEEALARSNPQADGLTASDHYLGLVMDIAPTVLREAYLCAPGTGGEEAERFFRLVRLHSHEVPEKELAHHRVPAGTRFVGRLYIAPDGDLVVTDGWPADEDAVADDHPDAHNCDEMGCSTMSHVVARLRAPSGGTREPGEEWRPIETAPKDGKRVLLVSVFGDMSVAYWHNASEHGITGWYVRGGVFSNPTHWMPLPAPPEHGEPGDG